MDMSLPLMDGCQATIRMRWSRHFELLRTSRLRLYNQWEWRSKAMLAGCNHFLRKGRRGYFLARFFSRLFEAFLGNSTGGKFQVRNHR